MVNIFRWCRSLPSCMILKYAAEYRKKLTKLLSEIGGNTAISIACNEIKERKKDGKTSDNMYILCFQTILEETANFSSTNKIGEGGFGAVYKVSLANKKIPIFYYSEVLMFSKRESCQVNKR